MRTQLRNRRYVLAGIAVIAGTILGALEALGTAADQRDGHAGGNWLELTNTHTHQTLKVTFRDESGFIPTALDQLENVLRDQRSGARHAMDPALYVLLADLAAAAGHEPRYEIISGFRSPDTNEKLRSRGGGQARNSQHIQGRALDVRLKGVPCARLRDLAVTMHRGGVGYYARSDFVHVDTARVRYWEG